MAEDAGAVQVDQGGHDAPITSAAEDCLDALRSARAIHRIIKSSPAGWSTRIGLYGTWGSGKTSILNLLGEMEKGGGSIVVRFSAWSATGETGLLHLFYDELARELTAAGIPVPKLGLAKRLVEKSRGITRFFGKQPKGTDTALGLPEGTLSVLGTFAEAGLGWFKISREDIQAMTSALGKRRVTVFIDDLDRADPKAIPKSLLALRELLDWPRFTFVLAFDKRMVASALTEYSRAYGDNAELFLEKVIDVGLEVPHPTEVQSGRLADAAFRACAPFVDEAVTRAARRYLPTEPRRVKQIARKLGVVSAVVARHDPGEIDLLALVLFNIVHEASAELASAAVTLANNTSENWELLLGSKKEREEREEAVRESLGAYLVGRSNVERDRVVGAALALMHRWSSTSGEQIAYLISLTYDEPSFTRKEVRALIDAWSCSKPLSLETEILSAATRSRCNQREAALELLKIAIDLYGDSLEEMAGSETESERSRHALVADRQLSFLEHALSVQDAPSISDAKKSVGLASQIVSLAGKWAGWTRNVGEEKLRSREQRLGLAVVASCDAPEPIYCGTDPFWESHHDGKDSPAAKWRGRVRAELLPRILDRLFAKFFEPDGILPAARGDEELSTWMLESVKSPLYVDEALSDRFAQLFQRDHLSSSESANLRDNAKLYLRMLLFQTRNGSWGGVEKIKEIVERVPDLLPNAWDAVVRHPVPFRVTSTLLKLKADLVSAGVDAARLNEPEWLVRAAAERSRIKD